MSSIVKTWENADIHKLLRLIFSTLLLVGCVSPAAYREPITRFQQASTVVIEGARIEYGVTNKRERDAVIDRLVAKRERINLQTLNDKEIRVLESPRAADVQSSSYDIMIPRQDEDNVFILFW